MVIKSSNYRGPVYLVLIQCKNMSFYRGFGHIMHILPAFVVKFAYVVCFIATKKALMKNNKIWLNIAQKWSKLAFMPIFGNHVLAHNSVI